jgi:hypothetical protein
MFRAPTNPDIGPYVAIDFYRDKDIPTPFLALFWEEISEFFPLAWEP